MRYLPVMPRHDTMNPERRAISIDGQLVCRTPLLVPSFSSKGFPDVCDALRHTKSMLTEAALVSAYDIKHYNLKVTDKELAALAVMFIDSGGYETSKDDEFARLAKASATPVPWSRANHHELLQHLHTRHKCPTVIVSYDSPHQQLSYKQQLQKADELFKNFPKFGHEILLKPTKKGGRINVAQAAAFAKQLCGFDIIGVTEKDLGNGVFDRMKAIADLRRAIDAIDHRKPLHVFGSLDPITTPLYFLSGADVFDGLTWLRFKFHEGYATYANTAILKHTARKSEPSLELQTSLDNLSYLMDLSDQMRRFLERQDYTAFRHHCDFLKDTTESLKEEVR